MILHKIGKFPFHFYFLMKFTNQVPLYNKEYSHQTKLTSVTDDEFEDNDAPYKSTFKDRLIQLAFFIIFFGWLRLILIGVITAIYLVLMAPVLLFASQQAIVKHITPYGIFVTQMYFRLVFFLCGLYRIRIKGNVDKRAKLILFNHSSNFEGPIIYLFRPFIVIGMAELKKAPVIGPILTAVNTVFVDRSIHGGTSKIITDYLNSKNEEPMALAPEGRCTKGHFLMEFRTGAFIANVPIQPVTVRYTHFLPYGKTGVVWTHGHLLEWIIRLICMPGCIVDVHFMPVVEGKEFYSKTSAEKALYCNLLMANDLCTMASDRSNRTMFLKNGPKLNLKTFKKSDEL